MSPAELEKYLHEHIPLSKAMETTVISVDDDAVALSAPLEPNLNHRGTAFGGSVATLAILSGWTHVHFKLRREGIETHTVIHESSVHYDKPIQDRLIACCGDLPPEVWARFIRTLKRKGKARIRVQATVHSAGQAACSFQGSYVATLRELSTN